MRTWYRLIDTPRLHIRAHYTWLVFVPLAVWTLASLTLPARLGAGGAMWSAAVLIVALWIASVALHDLAHVVAARLVRQAQAPLNVYPIGALEYGVRTTSGPWSALIIALAGPVANLAAFVLLIQLNILPGTLAAEAVAFAASFNLTLGLMSLLPGLPLDGGRAVRALVWLGSDYDTGTRAATVAGYIVVAIVVVIALLRLGVPGDRLAGMWTLLLAWLLSEGAAAGERRRHVAALAERWPAARLLHEMDAVAPAMSLRTLARLWHSVSAGRSAPVTRHGCLIGSIDGAALHDIPQSYWDERTVGDTMQPLDQLTVLETDSRVAELLQHVAQPDTPAQLLLVEHGRLAGVIDADDLRPLQTTFDAVGLSPIRPVERPSHSRRPLVAPRS